MQYFERLTIEQLSENVTGVMHNVKSALMAVNGYLDLLAPEKTNELYQQAKRSTVSIDNTVDKLVLVMCLYRNTQPMELSLNDCVRSTMELMRSATVTHTQRYVSTVDVPARGVGGAPGRHRKGA